MHFPHLPHLASLFWFGLGGLVRQKVVRGAVFVTNNNAPMLLDVRRKDGDAHRTHVHRRYKEALLAQERLVFLPKIEHSELHNEYTDMHMHEFTCSLVLMPARMWIAAVKK